MLNVLRQNLGKKRDSRTVKIILFALLTSSVYFLPIASAVENQTEVLLELAKLEACMKLKEQSSRANAWASWDASIHPLRGLSCAASGFCIARLKQASSEGRHVSVGLWICATMVTLCTERIVRYCVE